MRQPKENNIAYIDGANLHNGVKSLPWNFDYAKFRIWLLEKCNVVEAYLFLGLIDKNVDLYAKLKKDGYLIIFKETSVNLNGKLKGNCDADLIVLLMQHLYEGMFDKAVLISSDGDYVPLVKLLIEKDKIDILVSPYSTKYCSVLLKRTDVKIIYLEDQKAMLETKLSRMIKNEKTPDEDKTS